MTAVAAPKKYKGAPFGVQTARFDVSGVHPKNKMPGTFTEIPYDKKSTDEQTRKLGPGMYHVDQGGFHPKAVDERASGPGWSRQYEVERMAALPHLLHKDQWQERQMLKRKLGPGSYNIKDFVQVMGDKPRSTRGICDGRAARFGRENANPTPGPGTYGKGGVPHSLIEEKAQRSASTKGMLDAHSGSRSQPSVGCHLGPGTYNFRSSSEEMINKMTSVRGPYDLFSGDRNKPISDGHFAAPKLANLGPGQYDIKSSLDEWNGEHKQRKGKFGTVAQYPRPPTERIYNSVLSQCPRDQDFPGPGTHDPQQLSKPHNHKQPGFLSSAERVDRRAQRFFTGNFNPVGAGRYDIQKFEEAQHRNGHQSDFKSKTGKPSYAFEKFLKERVRGKDVPVAERSYLVTPQGLPSHQKPRHMYSFNRSVTVA
ncbi:ciliary microtubule-associated protein 2-like isoform X2 [Babylonia areolata]|uniref:ciliary microtubule-associated protein 2-like isoform X2 n=1 Tax=Babylonia areolata TaxID=304850 RepID=UPI003FD0AB9E